MRMFAAQLLCGLFEVLTQESLLRLQSVTDAVTHVLLKLSLTHDLALDEAGRYHGLYRLMGHPSSEVRALVGACPTTTHKEIWRPKLFSMSQILVTCNACII